jgi:hypothetical protein
MQQNRSVGGAVEGSLGGFCCHEARGMNAQPNHIQVTVAISPKNPTTAIATKKRSMAAIVSATLLRLRQRRLGFGLGVANGLRKHLA